MEVSLRKSLELTVAGLTEGVILIHSGQTLLWANDAALRMHCVAALDGLGTTVDDYRCRFELRYRNNHRLGAGEYPVERVVPGEAVAKVTVEVAPAGQDESR